MAADFIGVTVLVTLNDPPDTKIRGFVTDVVEQQLSLCDGRHLSFDSAFGIEDTNEL